jgi:hypothetical protein
MQHLQAPPLPAAPIKWSHARANITLRVVMQVQAALKSRQPSPVHGILEWGRPKTADETLAELAERSRRAAQLRHSYEQQIEQREALHSVYASAENVWPYQPVHHPEAKLAYFTGPKCVLHLQYGLVSLTVPTSHVPRQR